METKANPWMISTLLLVGLIVGFGSAQLPFFDKEVPAPSVVKGSPKKAEEDSAKVKPAGSISVKEVSASDHIRGAKNAKVTFVEFSDTECPFCKKFHSTMQELVEKFPNDVRWVYRHFPLDVLHKKARKEAEATECAAELGGNEKFWAYIDRLFEVTPSNDGLDPAQLPKIAQYIGLNVSEFEKCLKSGRHAGRVAENLADAVAAGGDGTPYTIIIAPNGEKLPLSGALPYAQVSSAVEGLLK